MAELDEDLSQEEVSGHHHDHMWEEGDDKKEEEEQERDDDDKNENLKIEILQIDEMMRWADRDGDGLVSIQEK